MERVVHEKIENFLSSQNLLYKFQSDFRKLHSTEQTLLFYLTGHIKKEVDKYCGMVMLDLQNVFDTVTHTITG